MYIQTLCLTLFMYLGVYTVRRNHSSPQCQQSSEQLSEIHVKIRINSNGILEVVHAKCTKYGDTIEGLGQPQLYAVESSPNESSVPKPMTELHIHSKEPGHVRKLEQLFELEVRRIIPKIQICHPLLNTHLKVKFLFLGKTSGIRFPRRRKTWGKDRIRKVFEFS